MKERDDHMAKKTIPGITGGNLQLIYVNPYPAFLYSVIFMAVFHVNMELLLHQHPGEFERSESFYFYEAEAIIFD